ncbi:MAG: hypothetical protein Q8Q58_03040 [Candidatus Rokubacteria bacterium]|nr:hypothetical protein [Candidatus Rokubacteria bacterium]
MNDTRLSLVLKPGQALAQPALPEVADAGQELERYILADDGRGLEQVLLVLREAVDAGGQYRLDGGRRLERGNGPGGAVPAALAGERSRLDQMPHRLLEKERVALRPLDQEGLQRAELVGAPE